MFLPRDQIAALREGLMRLPQSTPGLPQVQELLVDAESGRSVFSRAHFIPGHFTASGFVLSPDAESLLLIFHRKLRLWLQPGGHFEESDATLIDAARREVGEETGKWDATIVRDLLDVDVHRIPPFGNEPEHFHHDLRVLFRAQTFDLVHTGEVDGCRWFPLVDLLDAESRIETDESVLRVARWLVGSSLLGGPSGSH